jgi:REP element-mobilizing transposase RayT
MTADTRDAFLGRGDHLKRLPAEFYRGDARVHWSMTIDGRRIGWLTPVFYYRFRELLTHTAFRFELACPVFCCMPDHLHLLWMGLNDLTDQLQALRYFRKYLNQDLERIGFRLQREAYDRVLRDDEGEEKAFEDLVEYIARNPERAGLVPIDGFRTYPFTNCILPGYPDLRWSDADFWTRFWRATSWLRNKGLSRIQP